VTKHDGRYLRDSSARNVRLNGNYISFIGLFFRPSATTILNSNEASRIIFSRPLMNTVELLSVQISPLFEKVSTLNFLLNSFGYVKFCIIFLLNFETTQ
jgi:hypothetical protein